MHAVIWEMVVPKMQMVKISHLGNTYHVALCVTTLVCSLV